MTRKILVVDDDRDLVRALSLRLQHAGYDVISALDAYQATQFAQHERPDLVLMDLHMPAGDGFDVHERMRRYCDLADTPVIMLTGDRSDEVKTRARDMGAAGLIYKPYDEADLLSRIANALGVLDASEAA